MAYVRGFSVTHTNKSDDEKKGRVANYMAQKAANAEAANKIALALQANSQKQQAAETKAEADVTGKQVQAQADVAGKQIEGRSKLVDTLVKNYPGMTKDEATRLASGSSGDSEDKKPKPPEFNTWRNSLIGEGKTSRKKGGYVTAEKQEEFNNWKSSEFKKLQDKVARGELSTSEALQANKAINAQWQTLIDDEVARTEEEISTPKTNDSQVWNKALGKWQDPAQFNTFAKRAYQIKYKTTPLEESAVDEWAAQPNESLAQYNARISRLVAEQKKEHELEIQDDDQEFVGGENAKDRTSAEKINTDDNTTSRDNNKLDNETSRENNKRDTELKQQKEERITREKKERAEQLKASAQSKAAEGDTEDYTVFSSGWNQPSPTQKAKSDWRYDPEFDAEFVLQDILDTIDAQKGNPLWSAGTFIKNAMLEYNGFLDNPGEQTNNKALLLAFTNAKDNAFKTDPPSKDVWAQKTKGRKANTVETPTTTTPVNKVDVPPPAPTEKGEGFDIDGARGEAGTAGQVGPRGIEPEAFNTEPTIDGMQKSMPRNIQQAVIDARQMAADAKQAGTARDLKEQANLGKKKISERELRDTPNGKTKLTDEEISKLQDIQRRIGYLEQYLDKVSNPKAALEMFQETYNLKGLTSADLDEWKKSPNSTLLGFMIDKYGIETVLES